MLSFEDVCSRFRVADQKQDSAQAYCPCHAGGNESNASLTLTRGQDGRTLLYCHVCGKERNADILKAVGLTFADVSPDRKRGKTLRDWAEWPGKHGEYAGAKFVTSYDYCNANGYCYTKVRIALPDKRKKTFKYCTTDAEGRVDKYSLKGIDRHGYLALYPFHEVADARAAGCGILYTEGEKDVNNAIADGFFAVTAGGANDWTPDLTTYFMGMTVYVVPDCDHAGITSALRVAGDLDSHGCIARVIVWPDEFREEYPKGDYSDFVGKFAERSEGVAAFSKLTEGAVTYQEFRNWAADHDEQEQKPDEAEPTYEVPNDSAIGDVDKQPADADSVARLIYDEMGGATFPVSDLENGRLIGGMFKGLRYNTTAKEWYLYDGKRWLKDERGMRAAHAGKLYADGLMLYCAAYMASEVSADDLARFRTSCASMASLSRRKHAIEDAQSTNPMSTLDLDRDPDLFNCGNGVLDLKTLTLRSHDPTLMLSKLAGCDYDPNADMTAWESFIEQVTMGDRDKAGFLQAFAGYCMTGRPVEEKMQLLYGPTTRNGKGTYCSTLMRMFGDYGYVLNPESLATMKSKNARSASPDLMGLKGARFVNVSEPSKGLNLDVALTKTLTGGDPIKARNLYEGEVEFWPTHTIVMNCNYRPNVNDMTLFESGRVTVVTFDRHFEESEQDKGLKERLAEPENLSAVLNWCVEGLRQYREHGLVIPQCVRDATAEYASDSDKLKQFIHDEMLVRPSDYTPASAAYERYQSWCSDAGYRAEGKQNFYQMLRAHGLMADATIDGQHVNNAIPGYRLNPDTETGRF